MWQQEHENGRTEKGKRKSVRRTRVKRMKEKENERWNWKVRIKLDVKDMERENICKGEGRRGNDRRLYVKLEEREKVEIKGKGRELKIVYKGTTETRDGLQAKNEELQTINKKKK